MIYLTPKEVADRLGVHLKTVYNWIKAKKIEYIQVGDRRAIRIPESAIEAKREIK